MNAPANNAPIPASSLLINPDGSIYHLHLRPEQLEERILLVGDRSRSDLVAEHLNDPELLASNREYRAIRGFYNGQPLMVMSTGMGAGAVEIAVNELDALANIDFTTRTIRAMPRSLTMVRLGTSGALGKSVKPGEAIITALSLGFDSVPYFYADMGETLDRQAGERFAQHMGWSERMPTPYAAPSTPELVAHFAALGHSGITLCCPGFFGPQARALRLQPALPDFIDQAVGFSYNGNPVLNMEMESAPINALARALGHRSVTICLAINNRVTQEVLEGQSEAMHALIERVLGKIVAV